MIKKLVVRDNRKKECKRRGRKYSEVNMGKKRSGRLWRKGQKKGRRLD